VGNIYIYIYSPPPLVTQEEAADEIGELTLFDEDDNGTKITTYWLKKISDNEYIPITKQKTVFMSK